MNLALNTLAEATKWASSSSKMIMKRYFLLANLYGCCFTALGLMPIAASGQFMLSPEAVIGTDLGTFSSDVPLTNMINQSGLDEPFISGTTDFDTYFANPGQTFATNDYHYNWQSDFSFDLPLMGYVDFDLGDSFNLNKLAVWNISISNVVVRISDDTNSLATGQIAGSFTLTDHQHFTYSYPVDILDFGATFQGRYVRLEVNSANEYKAGDGYAYATVGEVVLSAAPVTATAPAVNISRDPNGDVRITFTGILQSSTNIAEIFDDVPGSPQSVYVIPKESLSSAQFFRAKGN